MKKKGKMLSDNIKIGTAKKLNPFEVHINRSKHQVLGRKLKSDRGLPGVSKNKALMKRKATLLQEYKIRGKSNQFIDQRIGERNKNMTEDDRIMARFAAERMRTFNKKAMFNLSDTEVLTHKGQTLSEIERFEDTRSDEEEDDEGRRTSGALKGKFVENAHFGGGMFTKSKQDRESLIDELINESKKRKAERQRNKEETLEATEQLDEEWKSLGMIVTSTKDAGEVNDQKKDQYDLVMRQLKFEPHGQPSQRLKTEEEIAKEEKEQMEKAKKELMEQLREIGIDRNKYSHKSADDLDDGFANYNTDLTENDLVASDNEDENSHNGKVEGSRESSSNGESESESDTDKENEDEKENGEEENGSEPKKKRFKNVREEECEETNDVVENSESEEENEGKSSGSNEESSEDESSDEECAMDDLTDMLPSIDKPTNLTIKNETPQKKTTERRKTISEQSVSSENQPTHEDKDSVADFVLSIPEDYDHFKGLFENRSKKQQTTILEGLITTNHPSLKPGNKEKMLKLAGFIIEIVSKCDVTWESLPAFASQFHKVKEFNKQECMNLMFSCLKEKLESLQENPSPDPTEMKYLTWFILLFMRPQGYDTLFPVKKPALSLACRIGNSTDWISIGLFCYSLILQEARTSSLLQTGAIVYLLESIERYYECAQQKSCKTEQKSKNNANQSSEEWDNLEIGFNCGVSELESAQKVLHCSLKLLSDCVASYRSHPHAKTVFGAIQIYLNETVLSKEGLYPPPILREIRALRDLMEAFTPVRISSCAKTAKKAKALRQYEPAFGTVTVGKSQKGLPAEVQEEQKLLHKYKHEMKGAMRELRRDRAFLANVKLKEKALSDEQRIKKVKEIFSSGAAQQGELRSLKRKK